MGPVPRWRMLFGGKMKTPNRWLKSVLIPLVLGLVVTLISYYGFSSSLMHAFEYAGIALLLIAVFLYFAGMAEGNPRRKKKKEEADTVTPVGKREPKLVLRQSLSIIWAVIGFLFLLIPVFL